MAKHRIRMALPLVLLLTSGAAGAQTGVRIASYNIRFLNAGALAAEGDRRDKLLEVIRLLEADVVGLQEIADRAALEAIFPPADWNLVIDDQSGDAQDLAAAVRKPLEVLSPADLDADDEHFLFSDSSATFFPNRRDVLAVHIRVPSEDHAFWFLVHHAKSRAGGRAFTDPRREGAAQRIVRRIELDFGEDDVVLVGDFNDTPDDRSLNILESGDPDAVGEAEDGPGDFLVNLTEPVYAAGHVTLGLKSNDVHGGLIDTVVPGARAFNNQLRGTDAHTGDQMFDQLLVSRSLLDEYIPNSAGVFDVGVAALGNQTTRASDHLPVFADLLFLPQTPGGGPVTIIAALPNPDGADAGNERLTLRNSSSASIDLTGWSLRDRAGNTFALGGSIGAGQDRLIQLTPHTMPLNNTGDDIELLDGAGSLVHRVSYERAQVMSGVTIRF